VKPFYLSSETVLPTKPFCTFKRNLYRYAVRRAGVRPDRITFGALIAACGHGGRWDKALEIFRSMKTEHSRVEPDAAVYGMEGGTTTGATTLPTPLTALEKIIEKKKEST
jgi:pentatricopeptide repeat protein